MDKLKPAPVHAQASAGDSRIRIYLISDRRDSEGVVPVEDYLFNLGYDVIPPAPEGDDADILLQYHKDSLLLCDAALIYHDHSPPLCLQLKLNDLRKAAGWGRSEPMLARAVLVAGPETIEKTRFRTHEAMVIRSFGDFSPETLRPFLDAIQQARDAKGR